MGIQSLLAQLFPQPQLGLLLSVLAVVGLDWAVGILAALRTGTFSLGVIANQLRTLLLFLGGLIVLQLSTSAFFGGSASGGATSTFVLAATAAIGQSSRDILVKVGILLGGGPPSTPLTITARSNLVNAMPALAATMVSTGTSAPAPQQGGTGTAGTSTTALPQQADRS